MRDAIHLHANDPVAWMAYEDWLKEQELPWEQPWIVNSIGMRLALISGGVFLMGTINVGLSSNEWQHEVEITRPFYMGVYPVTQAQYEKVMGCNPSYFCATGEGRGQVAGIITTDFPVENVLYAEAVEFCKKLSALPAERQAGRSYRLPTEAEWEYSCRGGASSYQVFHFGNSLYSTQANFNGKYPYGGAEKGPYLERTCTVGSYKPNKFGLYDMHGNVLEWCSDWYEADYYGKSPRRDPRGPSRGYYRVVRGGSWFNYGQSCRSAFRINRTPEYRISNLGFRLISEYYDSGDQ
jgi:formylglycine-generating enzyme required for sulfatase activity